MECFASEYSEIDFLEFEGEWRGLDLKDEKLLYNVRETAAVLGVNVHLVYELINRKLLPALRLGSLKVRKSTLIDFVERYEGMDLSDLDNIKELQQNMN